MKAFFEVVSLALRRAFPQVIVPSILRSEHEERPEPNPNSEDQTSLGKSR